LAISYAAIPKRVYLCYLKTILKLSRSFVYSENTDMCDLVTASA